MTIDFNENWRFRKAGGDWVPVTLPHDAMLIERRSASAVAGVNNGYFPGGIYEYEKRFSVDLSVCSLLTRSRSGY